jgi:hypothetical protein
MMPIPGLRYAVAGAIEHETLRAKIEATFGSGAADRLEAAARENTITLRAAYEIETREPGTLLSE